MMVDEYYHIYFRHKFCYPNFLIFVPKEFRNAFCVVARGAFGRPLQVALDDKAP